MANIWEQNIAIEAQLALERWRARIPDHCAFQSLEFILVWGLKTTLFFSAVERWPNESELHYTIGISRIVFLAWPSTSQ
jgi:hypothetical protein